MALGNQIFRNGALWLPVGESSLHVPKINQSIDRTIPPLMTKGDTGSLLPFIEFSIPQANSDVPFFDSFALPYENIVDFTHTVFALGNGETTGFAELTFLDNSPVLIETLTRLMFKAFRTNKLFLNVSYGWRISNPPVGLTSNGKDSNYNGVDGNRPHLANYDAKRGLFKFGPIPFYFLDATYKYSTYGIISKLTLNTVQKGLLNLFKINDTNFATSGIMGQTDFQTELENFVNKNMKNNAKYKVLVLDDQINYANITNPTLAFDNTQTVSDAIGSIVNKLTVPTTQKEAAGGEISWFVSNTKITDNGEEFFQIYIYTKDKPLDLSNASRPIITFPNYESPIISFEPHIDIGDRAFLSSDLYKSFSFTGDEKQEQTIVNAISTAWDIPLETSNPSPVEPKPKVPWYKAQPKEEPSNAEIAASPRRRTQFASIKVTMLGEPILSTIEAAFNTEMEVKINNISRSGMFRDEDDFFNNFPQFTDSSRVGITGKSARGGFDKIPLSSKGITSEISPFNGIYQIQEITNKINLAQGFVTDLTLKFIREKI